MLKAPVKTCELLLSEHRNNSSRRARIWPCRPLRCLCQVQPLSACNVQRSSGFLLRCWSWSFLPCGSSPLRLGRLPAPPRLILKRLLKIVKDLVHLLVSDFFVRFVGCVAQSVKDEAKKRFELAVRLSHRRASFRCRLPVGIFKIAYLQTYVKPFLQKIFCAGALSLYTFLFFPLVVECLAVWNRYLNSYGIAV